MDLTEFDWNHMRAFVATAESGSFSGAARRLRTTQPTIGRQIAALEDRLAVTLFERIGHKLRITPTGIDLLHHARRMEGAAQDIGRIAFGQSNATRGRVVITATDLYAHRVLTPLLPDLQKAAPDIQIVIAASNDRFDLQKREADIALRNGDPVEPELVQTRLPDGLGKYYAAKPYVARHGPFDRPEDASRGQFIDIDTDGQWMGFLNSLGMPVTPDQFTFQTESLNLMWDMVCNGMGIGPCDMRIGAREPRVQAVFETLDPMPIPTYLMVHRDVRTNKRVRTVFDFLVAALSV